MRILTTIPGVASLALFVTLLLPASASAVTVDEIVSLSKAGVSEQVILALIDRDKTIFSLPAERIVALQKDGVSDAIVIAMLRSGREEPPVATEAQPVPMAQESEPDVVDAGSEPDRPDVANSATTSAVAVPYVVPYLVPVAVPVRGAHAPRGAAVGPRCSSTQAVAPIQPEIAAWCSAPAPRQAGQPRG